MEKFNERELEILGSYQSYGGLFGWPVEDVPKFDTPITPKENFYRFLRGEDYCWVPDISRDFNTMLDDTTPDCCVQNTKGGFDAFGTEWVEVTNAPLPAFVKPGNPLLKDIADWCELDWPDPDSWDWKGIKKRYTPFLYEDRVNYGMLPNAFFERLIHLMDSENALCSLVAEPEDTAELMMALAEYQCRILEHYKKDLDVGLVWLSDDWGTQIAPFFSRTVLNEVIGPAYKKVIEKARELGIYVITHSCGKIASYLEDIANLGIMIFEPQIMVNPEMFDLHNAMKERFVLEDYSFFTDAECENTEQFREQMTACAKKYLSNRRVMITSGISQDMEARHRIMYEILRKSATGEI